MARILPFAKAGAERMPGEQKVAGELVIFPGVRVEYHDNPPEPRARGRRRRPRRKSEKDALSG